VFLIVELEITSIPSWAKKRSQEKGELVHTRDRTEFEVTNKVKVAESSVLNEN